MVEESGELLYMQRSVLSRFCLFAVRNELLLVLKGYWHKSEECLSYNIILLILHPFNGLFSTTTWVGQYQEGKTSLDLNEARDDGVWGCSDISWTICKQSAPRSSQITTPTTRHRIFAGRVHSCRPANGVKALNNFLSSCRWNCRELRCCLHLLGCRVCRRECTTTHRLVSVISRNCEKVRCMTALHSQLGRLCETHTQPFNGPLSGTTRVGRYQKKHSPTHTDHDRRTSFINLLHLLRSIATSVFSLCAWQSSFTTSLQVLFGLSRGLGPSTSYSMHFWS